MSVPVPQLDLAVSQGSRFVQPVLVTTNGLAVPLAVGTRARLQMRGTRESATVLAELTTETSGLVVDATNAKVTITLSSALTTAFTFDRALYDLELIYPDNEVERIVEGKVYVFPSVTKG